MIAKIGHRGVKGYVVENTLESFEKAMALGVDGVELDVHCCASGELVVFHDFTLDRLTNAVGAVSQFSLKELQSIKVREQYKIPTLVEVLELIDRKCSINIELKGHNTATPVFELLTELIESKNWKPKDFLISSFQYEELERFSKFQSKIPLAVLTQASVEQALDWALQFKAKAIHPHYSLLTHENCEQAKENGLLINTWTVNSLEDIMNVKQFEIDGIISDFPDRI